MEKRYIRALKQIREEYPDLYEEFLKINNETKMEKFRRRYDKLRRTPGFINKSKEVLSFLLKQIHIYQTMLVG